LKLVRVVGRPQVTRRLRDIALNSMTSRMPSVGGAALTDENAL